MTDSSMPDFNDTLPFSVPSMDVIAAWQEVQADIPNCGLRDNALAAIEFLQAQGNFTYSLNELGDSENGPTASFFRAVDRKYGGATMKAQAIKAFPWNHCPEALRAKAAQFKKYSQKAFV